MECKKLFKMQFAGFKGMPLPIRQNSRSLAKKFVQQLYIVFLFLLVCPTLSAQYPPPPGQPGSTAIKYDTAIIQSWATGCEVHRGFIQIDDPLMTDIGSNRPASNKATFGTPSIACGLAQPSSIHAVSLGDGGYALLTFDRPIQNGPGFDFAVFENAFSDYYLELAFVEVSSDGVHFVRFPSVSLTQSQTQVSTFGNLDPTKIHNLAGKYRQGYGTPFDLEDLAGSPNLNLNKIRYVKVMDVVGNINSPYASFDSQGNIINDPWPTPFWTGGFDLDAVAVINAGSPYFVSGFEELSLPYNSYWNGSDGSGGFSSGNIYFSNAYDPTYQSWSGWSYSSMTDTITPGFTNQYSAFTLDAFETGGVEGDSSIYAISYVLSDWLSGTYDPIPNEVHLTGGGPVMVSGLYVANTTYSALIMLHGDAYAKKFGGPSGNDPDWFKLIIRGFDADNNITGVVEFYLADYRFTDNSMDYVIKDWRWVDLSSLGAVGKLDFSLASTDTGMFGMNTPAYFCIDRLTLMPYDQTQINQPSLHDPEISAYPNPFTNELIIHAKTGNRIQLFNMQGQSLLLTSMEKNHLGINTSALNKGMYILRVSDQDVARTLKIIKQ